MDSDLSPLWRHEARDEKLPLFTALAGLAGRKGALLCLYVVLRRFTDISN